MNRHVNAIAGRLSLRAPQRRSLEILDRVVEITPPRKDADVALALAAIGSEFPTVTDFEREFPSLCFALATGVGKTRLMGAFISYLHVAHGFNNFFVLAPNLTIYNKLITDFTPNTSKYVFKGIAEFATNAPAVITGDTYEAMAPTLFDQLMSCKVNIFNISKIGGEVRGGRELKMRRLSEYIGQSYFDYLAALPDLVLIMDESHRYRASAGVKAINELRPVLGLELTATPYVESSRGQAPFKNVILDYPLARAMEDGFVKEPAVVTRRNFSAAGMTAEAVERMKLEDGVRLHEGVKVELETYARETGNPIVKPFLLVIARDTTHAAELLGHIESDAFFEGRYKGKAIQVDSSRSGAEEEEMITRLLRVEHGDEPTEIVIHVNMLKEGWDVTNLYTIVPLRAANARTLIEQSIGRGLRLPYGKRTGVAAVDGLNIVAHDRFQEIVDEANRGDSIIRMRQIIVDGQASTDRLVTVVSSPLAHLVLGGANSAGSIPPGNSTVQPIFSSAEEQRAAQIVTEVIRGLERRPDVVPSAAHLTQPAVIQEITRRVEQRYVPPQGELPGLAPQVNVAAIVAQATAAIAERTISIPRIQVIPRGEVHSRYRTFTLDLSNLRYAPVSEELWQQVLRTGEGRVLNLGSAHLQETRLEDYVVSGLVDFDDVSYDDHADLLYDLAAQVVRWLMTWMDHDQTRRVLQVHQREIAKFVHVQMQAHHEESATDYAVVVSAGYTELKVAAHTVREGEPVYDVRTPPPTRQEIGRVLYGGFRKCLYPTQRFDVDTERVMAAILERDSERWFRPVRGQFPIHWGRDHREYQPDFVAEAPDVIYMIETKRRADMESPEVVEKSRAAVEWCKRATAHSASYSGKPWVYMMIPHDEVAENRELAFLAGRNVTST